MVVKANPEFGIELALVVPYAYHLHTQGTVSYTHLRAHET